MPDGAFALYIAGQYNKRTAKKAAATRGACHGYLQFNKMVSLLPGNVLYEWRPPGSLAFQEIPHFINVSLCVAPNCYRHYMCAF